MLRILLIAGVLYSPVVDGGTSAPSLDALFLYSATYHNVPVRVLRAVCWVESNHRFNIRSRPDGPDASPSHGGCQVKYNTAKMLGFKGSVKELRSPATNIHYAAKYLRYQMLRYRQLEKALTAYNRGSYNKRKHRLYNNYVLKVKFAMAEGR